MSDELEEGRQEGADIDRLLSFARRHHLQFLLVLFAIWGLVWGASWVISPHYVSETTVLVQQPTIAQDYVAPNASDDIDAHLQNLIQQAKSRTNLLEIVNRFGLYKGASDEHKVDQMQHDLDIEAVRDPQKQDVTSIKITYTARNPQLAQTIAGELTNQFIDANARARLEASQGTTSFMDKQLADVRANLDTQDAKIRAFEAVHSGALPAQEAGNLQILTSYQAQLQTQQDSLNTARQQHAYLQSMIEQERSAVAKGLTTGSDAAGNGPPTELATVNQQLQAMRNQLAQLSSRYTDKYPDVLALKAEIAKTETLRDSLIASARKNGDNKASDGAVDPASSAAVRQLQSQLLANQADINSREASVASLQGRIADYQGRLNAEPGAAQELANMMQSYDQAKTAYDDLQKKRDQAAMATSLEQTHQTEHFVLLDPPTLPTKPNFPNRAKFSGMGLAAGLFLGLAIAGLFELFDDRLHGEKEIKALLPVAVISEIPEMVTPDDTQKAKRALLVGWTTAALVMTVIVAVSVFSFLYQ